MGKSSKYTHYIKRTDISGQTQYDIESHFGVLYMEAKGLNDVGQSKNIYTETYADSDRLRVALPNDGVYTAQATKVTMKFLVVGVESERQTLITNFETYLREGVHTYWDTARYREFDFIVTDEIKVSDEKWHGSTPYVEITVNIQNLNGKTRAHAVS